MRTLLALVALALTACTPRPFNPGDPRDAGARAAPVCSGVPCATGEICCYLTGRCFNPATDRGACMVDPAWQRDAGIGAPDGTAVDSATDAAGDSGAFDADTSVAVPGTAPLPRDLTAVVCASDADCRDDEYCGGQFCLGVGTCVSRTNCGFCSAGTPSPGDPFGEVPDPPPGTLCQVCGCNGVTYVAHQVACREGVRVAGPGACGRRGAPSPVRTDGGVREMRERVACGNDAQCLTGERCCSILGVCVDAACETCCRYPPEGASWPCRDSRDCHELEYCSGLGCEMPGGCVRTGNMYNCGGEVREVCGCNGTTYINACYASAANMRVASPGRCADN